MRTIIHAGRGHRIYSRGQFIHQPKPIEVVPDGEETETETAADAGTAETETAATATAEK